MTYISRRREYVRSQYLYAHGHSPQALGLLLVFLRPWAGSTSTSYPDNSGPSLERIKKSNGNPTVARSARFPFRAKGFPSPNPTQIPNPQDPHFPSPPTSQQRKSATRSSSSSHDSNRSAPPAAARSSFPLLGLVLLLAAGRRSGRRPDRLISPVLVKPNTHSLSLSFLRTSIPVSESPNRNRNKTLMLVLYFSDRSFLECGVFGFVRCF
jgi:hypothetical protein